jgi:hypothetical protein
MGRHSQYSTRNEWQKRVNPAFIKFWSATKAMHLASRIRDEKEPRAAFHRTFKDLSRASRLLDEERIKIKDPVAAELRKAISAPLDGEGKFEAGKPGMAYAINPESESLFRYLVFLKHGVTFRGLIMEMERNRSAYRKLLQVHQDYYRLLTGQLPLDRLKLKFNWDHFGIILEGLDFGLNQLNEIELAACLDEICPCAEFHSEEYFKKLRTEIRKACKRFVTNPDSTSWRLEPDSQNVNALQSPEATQAVGADNGETHDPPPEIPKK